MYSLLSCHSRQIGAEKKPPGSYAEGQIRWKTSYFLRAESKRLKGNQQEKAGDETRTRNIQLGRL